MSFKKIIRELLIAEQEHRPERQNIVTDPFNGDLVPQFVVTERHAVLSKVNELRIAKGLPPIDEKTLVQKAEYQATGHIDYTSQYAYYASHLAHGTVPAIP